METVQFSWVSAGAFVHENVDSLNPPNLNRVKGSFNFPFSFGAHRDYAKMVHTTRVEEGQRTSVPQRFSSASFPNPTVNVGESWMCAR